MLDQHCPSLNQWIQPSHRWHNSIHSINYWAASLLTLDNVTVLHAAPASWDFGPHSVHKSVSPASLGVTLQHLNNFRRWQNVTWVEPAIEGLFRCRPEMLSWEPLCCTQWYLACIRSWLTPCEYTVFPPLSRQSCHFIEDGNKYF